MSLITDLISDREKENNDPYIKPRKRCRNPESHKKYIAKQNVEHVSKSGKKFDEKVFQLQTICKCSRLCSNKIDEKQQKSIFDNYYRKCDWSQETLFIRSCVKTNEKASRTISHFC